MIHLFTPIVHLLASPVTLLEIGLAIVFRKSACLRILATLVILVNAILLLSSPGEMKAVWMKPSMTSGLKLSIQDRAPKPMRGIPGTMVVKTKFVALNPVDFKPFAGILLVPFVRWIAPLTFGHDASGVVISSGPFCQFKTGDEVFGFAANALAQEALMVCSKCSHKPKDLKFENAAALPVAAISAHHALEDMQAGDTIMVIGAAGGCGSIGVQLAKSKKAKAVFCVASDSAAALKVGCDKVFNYKTPTFSTDIVNQLGNSIDFVYDTASDVGVGVDYYNLSMKLLKTPNRNPNVNRIKSLMLASRTDLLGAIAIHTVGKTKLSRVEIDNIFGWPSIERYQDLIENHLAVLQSVVIGQIKDGLNIQHVEEGLLELQHHQGRGKLVFRID